MIGSQSLLAKLQALKHEPLAEQVRTIELLAQQNLDLFDEVERLVASGSDDSIFCVHVSEDREKVVLAALLAVLAADIATIPGGPSRTRHMGRLKEMCRLFDLEYEDVVSLAANASALETALAGRGLPANSTV